MYTDFSVLICRGKKKKTRLKLSYTQDTTVFVRSIENRYQMYQSVNTGKRYSILLRKLDWILLTFIDQWPVNQMFSLLKFSFSEKAIKLLKNLPLVLTLLSKTMFFFKTGGRFFHILWPFHNIWTLIKEESRFLFYKLFFDVKCNWKM